MTDQTSDKNLISILTGTRRIALVGASNKPDRPSYGVMQYLLRHGYEVVPVNPALAGQEIHGQTVVATLAQAGPFDMLELFRRPTEVLEPVQEAIKLGAKTIWMQLGVVNEEAAKAAREAGLAVVMDRCPAIELPRLGIGSAAH
ncbi:MAG: CoA-binding protein [Rhodospirillales bacterium]|nr:CoA-binding protein [Rhodospirillales bacterium]MDE2391092.1 CoA-binding protein [Rhodospirillales bacterium]MDE2458012.1 CoA-binding protein [Rhodospirillales bacterium]